MSPLLELLDDFIDRRCWLAGSASLHDVQFSVTPTDEERSGHGRARAAVGVRSCCSRAQRM